MRGRYPPKALSFRQPLAPWGEAPHWVASTAGAFINSCWAGPLGENRQSLWWPPQASCPFSLLKSAAALPPRSCHQQPSGRALAPTPLLLLSMQALHSEQWTPPRSSPKGGPGSSLPTARFGGPLPPEGLWTPGDTKPCPHPSRPLCLCSSRKPLPVDSSGHLPLSLLHLGALAFIKSAGSTLQLGG